MYDSVIAFWTSFNAKATLAGSIILSVTIPLLIWQLKSYNRSRKLEGFAQVISWLQNEETRKARRRLFELKDTSLEGWTANDKLIVEKVCHTYDTVGIMVKEGIISTKIIASWKTSIQRSWEIAKLLVDKYRDDREQPDLWDNYRWLAEEGFEHKSKFKLW